MINQIEATHCNCDAHVNGFVDLNGVPYLLGEYLDKRTFQQVDRSVIKSEINVDLSEAMRAVIDINVDDIEVNDNIVIYAEPTDLFKIKRIFNFYAKIQLLKNNNSKKNSIIKNFYICPLHP